MCPTAVFVPRETLRDGRFREVDAESAHVHAVEEGAEVLVEAAEAFVQELQVHEVGFQVGHAVAEFGEGGFQGCEREFGVRGACGAIGRCLRCA